MAFDSAPFVYPLRIVQAIFGIIVLGLMSYVISNFNWHGVSYSPSQANFLLFCSIWTVLVLVYLVLAPVRFQAAAHKFAILGVEFVTMIFWFAGFIAYAVFITGCGGGAICRANEAAVTFGAFEWLLFAATTAMAAMHCARTRGTSNTKHDPAIEIQQAV